MNLSFFVLASGRKLFWLSVWTLILLLILRLFNICSIDMTKKKFAVSQVTFSDLQTTTFYIFVYIKVSDFLCFFFCIHEILHRKWRFTVYRPLNYYGCNFCNLSSWSYRNFRKIIIHRVFLNATMLQSGKSCSEPVLCDHFLRINFPLTKVTLIPKNAF